MVGQMLMYASTQGLFEKLVIGGRLKLVVIGTFTGDDAVFAI